MDNQKLPGPPPPLYNRRGQDGKLVKKADPTHISNCCSAPIKTNKGWHTCQKCKQLCNYKEKK
jgi:hypothetical protein